MHYNFYFDICALCILATLAITSLSRRWVSSYRQRAYFLLFLATCMSTLSERVETYLQMNYSPEAWYHPAEMVLGSIYFIAHLGTGFFYLIYILAVLDIYIDLRKFSDFLTVVSGYLLGIILVIINFFVPILFYYDESGIYHRGKFIFLYYILAAYFIGYGLSLIFRYNKLMRTRTKMVILSYAFFIVVALVIQYFYPTILIENLLTTISIALVYISLQNPSEMVDDSLNILNRKAFLEGLEIKTGRSGIYKTIFITIDNIRALSDEIGYTQAQNALKRIAKYLSTVGAREFRLQTYVFRYSEYVFAMNVHTRDEKLTDSLLHAIATRMHEPWSFANMAIRVESHCFLMKYPEDYRSASELLSRLDIILENVDKDRDVIVDIKKDVYTSLRSIMDYDLIARTNLDTKKSFVKFQPMLSRVYKINYTVDTICFCYDEEGNEVDMRRHIQDTKVTRALLETDEFVYRRACRALNFWNGGDKNGKYRAIVGMSQGEISKNDLIRRLKKILREERAEASWITIKLSETTITTMNAVAERNVKLLGDMKCSIIVDKFGNGYGDLNRVLSLPVVQINIDHNILVQARKFDRMKLVAQGIVNLFHDISIFVGATDISCEEDKLMAEELGCDYIMGDYMCPPVSDSSFVQYIDAYFEEG